jgi:hypothetical protein
MAGKMINVPFCDRASLDTRCLGRWSWLYYMADSIVARGAEQAIGVRFLAFARSRQCVGHCPGWRAK